MSKGTEVAPFFITGPLLWRGPCDTVRPVSTLNENTKTFYNLPLAHLAAELQSSGKEKFRSQQLYQWVYRKGVTDFDGMSDLSKSFRHDLKDRFSFELPQIVTKAQSKDGTLKLLLDVGDGKTIESVLIPSPGRMTICVSSEIGCNMACQFCFTGKQKLQRRLRPYEIVGQFLQANAVLPEDNKISNIVFMGMGEPLDNLEGVFPAIDILCEDHGINFSRKKITVSTSGLVPHIPEVAKAKVRLAVSLNASNDEIRDEIMPINKKYPIKVLMEACRDYVKETGDRITFEYVLLKDVNDSLEDAKRVHQIVKSVPSKINLIPFNEHEGSDFFRPGVERVLAFQKELMNRGHSVFIRRTMGRDIYAACGQLRSKFEKHPSWGAKTNG